MKPVPARLAAGLLAVLALASLGLAACSAKAYDAEAAEILGYADEATGYRFSLSRDGAKVVGAWEDRKGVRFGLLNGEAGPDGDLKLRLSSNNTNRESEGFEGRISSDGSRLEGNLVPVGGGAPRRLGLARLPSFATGLKPARVRSEERGSLSAESEPSSFEYFSIEIAKPKALRDWYRAEMQGGRDGVAAIEGERDVFFEDFRAESRKLLDDFGPETVRPWRYEGRQFVAFRNDRLLVLGLGLSTYAGGAHGMHGVRYAIIDAKENRLLSPRDAFVPGCDEKLSDLLDAKVRDAFGFEPGASLAASKLFLTDRIPPTNNFFMFGGGVGFHYNAYEIAPYSTGDVWVEIRWEELGDCLAPGFRERYGL